MNLNKRGIINYLLLPVAAIFYLLSTFRRLFYQIGLLTTHHFKVPVIVVGNITVGGSGKTPVVIALTNYFKRCGKKVGVVSRGYGGIHKKGSLSVNDNTLSLDCGDEPLLIAIQTQAPVMVNKNRPQAVIDLINRHNVDLVISDDGLQHYSMGADVEICVVSGFGNGFYLPAGPLRESKNRLKTVDFVLQKQLKLCAFVNAKTGGEKPLNYFAQQTCHAVAGIGNPAEFFVSLTKLKIKIQPHAFADHYFYKPQDLLFADDYPILMSAKDWVKCHSFVNDKMWYLQVVADLDADFLTQLEAKL